MLTSDGPKNLTAPGIRNLCGIPFSTGLISARTGTVVDLVAKNILTLVINMPFGFVRGSTKNVCARGSSAPP